LNLLKLFNNNLWLLWLSSDGLPSSAGSKGARLPENKKIKYAQGWPSPKDSGMICYSFQLQKMGAWYARTPKYRFAHKCTDF